MNLQEFNHDLFLTKKYKLVTRGGIEVPKESVKPYNSISFPYCYLSPNGTVYSIGRTGLFDHPNRGSEHDLLMISLESIQEPIQTDETIPFNWDDYITDNFDIVDLKTTDNIIYHSPNLNAEWVQIVFEQRGAMNYKWREAHECLALKPRPITPYTHPQLYEVSDDEFHWWPLEKYYDDNLAQSWKHLAKCTVHEVPGRYKHLRLKQQPLEITKEMMIEKFGTDNYKMV
jgi:hypothetical protein